MRVKIDPVYVSEHALDQMPRLDQLTIVRNQVRKGFEAHDMAADGERVTEVQVEVAWLDGDVEVLVFDRLVGFPLEPGRDWYQEWKQETNG
mgnify:FL=1